MEYIHLIHEIEPYFNKDSEILILGSFPSVKSREAAFYYAHPQNRFWRLLAELFSSAVPENKEQKENLLAANKVALWDVIQSCDISGSSDASIKNAVVNDIPYILTNSSIGKIITNGQTAYRLYNKYLLDAASIPAVSAPSTSPANASYSFERLVAEWKKAIRD